MDHIDLEAFLKSNKIWYKLIHKAKTVHTAEAAAVTGLVLRRITKNLVSVTSEGEYALLIVPGDRRVDLKAAAKALNVRGIKLVPFDQAEKISGFPPGETPSIAHKTKMMVVIDRSIMEFETVYCGGGSRDKLLELRPDDINRLNKATTAKIVH